MGPPVTEMSRLLKTGEGDDFLAGDVFRWSDLDEASQNTLDDSVGGKTGFKDVMSFGSNALILGRLYE